MVIIKDQETPPLLCPLAKLIELLPGKDSLAQSGVSAPNGEYLRENLRMENELVDQDKIKWAPGLGGINPIGEEKCFRTKNMNNTTANNFQATGALLSIQVIVHIHREDQNTVDEVMREVQGRSPLVPDQFKCFGDEVGLRIRDLSSSNAQTIVKYLISNILFEAEMGKYNNGNLSTATYSQPLYPMTNYTQQQYSVPVTPAHPKSNRHFEQLSTSGRMQMTSPQSAMSSVSSAHSSTDYDSIDNILMEL
ncbi:unnamed protein product [Diabrotica balteata]|uniref:Uncharacterized protein n=1 Tax=Diabrotica balteata TaxID=107213 RepID=A0A9N9T5H6_DIABA|nr:unnamed protein product [Diabrotica balteata]